jgi:SPP1 gp7 family putative phage head morphogenesis protein
VKPVKATEKEYARALKKIARQAAHIVDIYADGAVISNPAAMMAELIKYANIIEPWANRVGGKMIASTAASVERMIKTQSREISAGLKEYLKTSSGQVALALQREQVMLIKSLPIEAGERAQKLAMDAVVGGRRPAEVAAEIMRTEEVTTSRAMLIARTESAKASAVITQERAKGIGATHYIWRTAQDSDVRESHAEMDGEVCAYDDPPIVDGEPLNPGEIYNCRCFAEIILPD